MNFDVRLGRAAACRVSSSATATTPVLAGKSNAIDNRSRHLLLELERQESLYDHMGLLIADDHDDEEEEQDNEHQDLKEQDKVTEEEQDEEDLEEREEVDGNGESIATIATALPKQGQ